MSDLILNVVANTHPAVLTLISCFVALTVYAFLVTLSNAGNIR